MPSGRVVVVGSANQDLTTYTSVLPQLGETIMGDTFQTSCGGKGANQACASASLGMAPVSMVCRVGKDVFGEALLGNFRRLGVEYDADTSVLSETSSGVAAITVDQESGDNMIIVTPGANHALTPSDVEDALKRLAKNSDSPPAVVVVQLEIKPESALQALKTGKELGAITILNPAPAPEGFSLEGFYPFVDILIPNESELQKICGSPAGNPNEVQMAESLLQKGVGKALVVTLGARGAMTVEKDGVDVKITMVDAPKDLPARKLPIKDTVGAGDGFCGALATYLAMGLTLSESAGKACGVASMSVRRQGASYPTWDELPDSLKMEKSEKSSGSKPTITFVTGNKKKLEEVQQILGDDASFAYELTSHKVDLPELQGDPVEIAKEKCKMAATKIGGACMTEDTSLCFNALNSMPGPYIKWFLDSCGHDGLNGMLSGFDDKTAYAQTVVAFTEGPDSEVHVFDGRTNGKIVPPRGSLDFGWDPIFEPDEGNGKTYAEMPKADKNSISHRGRSFAKLKEFLAKSRV
jgi:ribokinase/non-canonical purine NTP pyrophosphatase (RdgB/HAM1 family)